MIKSPKLPFCSKIRLPRFDIGEFKKKARFTGIPVLSISATRGFNWESAFLLDSKLRPGLFYREQAVDAVVFKIMKLPAPVHFSHGGSSEVQCDVYIPSAVAPPRRVWLVE